MPKKITKARPWFPVSDGISDHFEWLHGARLRIFLIILRETKWSGTWSGWKVTELAARARCTRKHAHKALQQLAHLSPTWPRRKYIDLTLMRGAGVNTVSVRKALRADEKAEPDLLEKMLETDALSIFENRRISGRNGPTGDTSSNKGPTGDTSAPKPGVGGVSSEPNRSPTGDKLSPVGPLWPPGVQENKVLTSPSDSEDSEKRRGEGSGRGASTPQGGTRDRRVAEKDTRPDLPPSGISDGPEGETDQEFSARAVAVIRAQLDELKGRPKRRDQGFQRLTHRAQPAVIEQPERKQLNPGNPGTPRKTELEQEEDPWS